MKDKSGIYKSLIFVIILNLSLFGYAQVPKFNSDADVKKYLSSNITDLDPLEGFWEGTFTRDSNSPYASPQPYECSWILIKGSDGWIYFLDNGYSPVGTRFRRIGETNNFKWELSTSSGIVSISSPFKIDVKFDLNRADSKSFAGNKNFIYSVYLLLQMAKDYPTYSMYEDAIRNSNKGIASETEEWSGTGFALRNGYIVTNYHVIDGAKYVSVKGVAGDFNKTYKASIFGVDKNNDLALLKIEDSSFPGFGVIPYSISSSTSEVGEEVFVLGYPLTSTMGDEIKLTTGIISSKTGYQGDVALYQISTPIQPGNSGGPLFDKKGNVIGIVSAKHAGAENVGYAVKASYLKNLIESSANTTIIPMNNSVSTLPLTGKVKSEKNFVFFIKCSSKGK